MEQLAIDTQSTARAERTQCLHSLHAARLEQETEVRALKARLRVTWRTPMEDAQWRLNHLRATLTEIYIALAFARGRVHRRSAPQGWPAHREGSWEAVAYARRITARRAPELLLGEPS